MPVDYSISLILPEIILGFGALALLMVGAFRGEKSAELVTGLAIAVLAFALLAVCYAHKGDAAVGYDGAVVQDNFGRFMSALALIGSLGTLVMAIPFLRQQGIHKFEFPILILLSTMGMLVLIASGSLITLYLGFELMSLALYVIAAFHRDDVRASEAGLKYFVLGALSSGLLLYGASLIYGFAGTVAFRGIAQALQGHQAIGVIFGLVFLSAGLAFKMSTVPFHMWTPDVYEGAPTPVTAFFATAPKMAAVAIAVRVMITALPGIILEWQQIIAFISVCSMVLGSFAAIGQTNFKRLMAYSAIGNMGFALTGLAAGTEAGVYGVLVYMATYLVMTLGVFAAIMSMQRGGKAIETVADLSGLSQTNPWMAFFLLLIMFSLAGVPPLAGFFAKFFVFQAAVQANLWFLAVVGVLASVVAAYYYLRIVKIMYFDPSAEPFDRQGGAVRAVLATSGLVMLFVVAYPAPITGAIAAAARSLF